MRVSGDRRHAPVSRWGVAAFVVAVIGCGPAWAAPVDADFWFTAEHVRSSFLGDNLAAGGDGSVAAKFSSLDCVDCVGFRKPGSVGPDRHDPRDAPDHEIAEIPRRWCGLDRGRSIRHQCQRATGRRLADLSPAEGSASTFVIGYGEFHNRPVSKGVFLAGFGAEPAGAVRPSSIWRPW